MKNPSIRRTRRMSAFAAFRNACRAAATITAVALPGPSAFAAEAAEPGALEEITVFAERRSEARSLREVPMAVSAIGGLLVDEARLQSVVDVGRLAPNTQLDPVGTFPGFSNFSIRGVGNSNSTRSIDSPVNIIQDGMVIDYEAGAVLDTFDLESVEILRGRRACCSAGTPPAARWCCVPGGRTRRARSTAG